MVIQATMKIKYEHKVGHVLKLVFKKLIELK